MKEFYGILAAGAFGGALSWLWSITLGTPLKLGQGAAVFASVLLGAGAAVIGVYLIANTDRKDIGRALAFAILCGFSWQIVYEAGTSTFERREARQEVDQSSASVTEAAKQLAAVPEQKKTEVVQDLVGETTALLQASRQAESRGSDQKATEGAISALNAIADAAPTVSPESTSTAAELIATSAIANGNEAVAQRAIETLAADGITPQDRIALEKIGALAEQKRDPATARLAREAMIQRGTVRPRPGTAVVPLRPNP